MFIFILWPVMLLGERCLSGKAPFTQFETVMQTLDYISGLHNFREISQPFDCLDKAILTRKKCSIAFIK